MSGASNMTSSEEHLRRLEQVLDRQVPIDALDALSAAVAFKKKATASDLSSIAIGVDSNVLLKLAGHKRREDIVDYFAGWHEAPLILPGQVIQEFWNNQFAAMQSVATQVKRHFDSLGAEIVKIDSSFGEFSERASGLMGELGVEYGYIRDNATIGHLASVCEMLSSRARLAYVPRMAFHYIAAQRKRTRTPPGFKDDGDGDFFVWADYLMGLLEELAADSEFKHTVLVTDDRKLDWSLGGVAHPVLAAEVFALTGATFEIWSLDRLAQEVSAAIAKRSASDESGSTTDNNDESIAREASEATSEPAHDRGDPAN